MTIKKDEITITHIPTKKSVVLKGLVKTFEDKFSPKWNSEEVYGRMDPIMTFQSTPRTISLTIDMVGETESTAKENWRSAQKLIQFMYPTYNSTAPGAGSISAAPLLKVKWGQQIYDPVNSGPLVCACTDLSLGNTHGITEKNIGYGSGGDITPQRFDITLALSVLHVDHKVGWTPRHGAKMGFGGEGAPKGNIVITRKVILGGK